MTPGRSARAALAAFCWPVCRPRALVLSVPGRKCSKGENAMHATTVAGASLRRFLALVSLLGLVALFTPESSAQTRKRKQPSRGVSLAGAEFGTEKKGFS